MEAARIPQATFSTVAIVNDRSSGVPDGEVNAIVAALAVQLRRDFGPAWHTSAHLRFVGQGHKPPAGAWTIAILDTSDQAGALGYHDLTPEGLPLGKVFAGTDRLYGQHMSVTLCHELLEMLVDPEINLVAQANDQSFYALEVCDPVQGDEYDIDGIPVSDFVTPAWFGGRSAFDHLGRVELPFELSPGGYISRFDPASGQGWTQLNAQSFHLDDLQSRPKVGSRRERRFIPRSQWVTSDYEQDPGA